MATFFSIEFSGYGTDAAWCGWFEHLSHVSTDIRLFTPFIPIQFSTVQSPSLRLILFFVFINLQIKNPSTMASSAGTGQEGLPPVNLKPLLTKLWPNDDEVTPDEIAEAISHFFTNQVTEAQTASLLMALHFTKLDFKADVLERCAYVMRKAAAPIPVKELQSVIQARGRKEGTYQGGLVRFLQFQLNIISWET